MTSIATATRSFLNGPASLATATQRSGAGVLTGGQATAAAKAIPGTLDSRLSDSKKTLETMTGMVKSMRRSRSGDSKERLKRLLEQVKILRKMGGDPKVVAKEAARLAKEIAAAAKEYSGAADSGSSESAAVGSPGGSGSVDAAASASAGDAATVAAPAVAAEGGTPTPSPDGDGAAKAEASAAVAQADGEARQAAGRSGDGADPQTTQGTQAAQTGEKPLDKSGTTPESRKEDVARLLAAGDSGLARSKAIDEDKRFFGEVKAAVASLRAMIQRAVAENRHKPGTDTATADQLKDVAKAAKAVDDAIDTIGQHGEGESTGSSAADSANSTSSAAGAAPSLNLVV